MKKQSSILDSKFKKTPKTTSSQSIMDLAGAWEMSDEEAEMIKKKIAEGWKRRKPIKFE